MDEILKKNLETISQANLLLLNDLLAINFEQIGEGIFEQIAENGRRNIFFNHDDKRYLLHSSFDPRAEARRMVQDIDPNRDYLFVVFGLGVGLHLFELKNKMSQGSRVIVVEHSLDVLKYALTNIDFSEVFLDGRFVLMFGNEKQLARQSTLFLSLNLYNLLHNMRVIILPNYYVYADKNKAILQQMTKVMLNLILAVGNDLEDQFLGFNNMCYNTDAIMKANSVEDIKGKYKNKPAIIVAAGPSLDKNIQYLKNANGKALIFACDASMRACVKHGVQPDVITSVERVVETYNFYYKNQEFPEDLVLAAPGSLWPQIYEEFPGKTIAMSRNLDGFEYNWVSEFNNFKFVSMGHSCATVAYKLAQEAGCNPIILIGQDLAYSSGKKHSELTHTEYEGNNDDRDADNVYVEDYEGNKLKSSSVYKMFKEWFEMQIALNQEIEVIDATEGGAYIQGSKLMTLYGAIEKFCHTPLEEKLVEYLPKVNIAPSERVQKYDSLIRKFSKDINLLKKIKKITIAHMEILLKVEKQLMQKCSEEQLVKLVAKMQLGDKIIKQINAEQSISSYYTPLIMQTIMKVKKLGNALTQENVEANCLLQHNLMFMIGNSIDLVIQKYTNAKEILETKYQETRADKVAL